MGGGQGEGERWIFIRNEYTYGSDGMVVRGSGEWITDQGKPDYMIGPGEPTGAGCGGTQRQIVREILQ